MRILVTGSAGFIGFHVAHRLLRDGHDVAGYDGMTAYYDVALKRSRNAILQRYPGYVATEAMLEDGAALTRAVDASRPTTIIHLAAQAGVRYSLENPRAYIDANLVGTFEVMEQARRTGVEHLLIASTSSVYGANDVLPFTEDQQVAHPLTLYAATKQATETMTHSYAHLWGIPTTAFRFFTVYGPWGRPDMALFKFTAAVLKGEPIDVYNHGRMARDFTYIDDLVEAITRLAMRPPVLEKGSRHVGVSPAAPYRVVNIGNGEPIGLDEFIASIEAATGKRAIRNELPMQPGDVPRTWADSTALRRVTGFAPGTPVREGVAAFVDWYRGHYGV